jgi:ribosomal protein S18 acetylase RimI-like enzyme
MEIVTAEERYVPEIVDLWEEFARFHEPFDPRYPMRDGVRSGYEIHMREEMAKDDTRVLIALDKDEVIGYAMAMIRKSIPWKRERYGYIEEMAVTSAYRRRGIGSALLEAVLTWFRSEKLDMVELTVAVKNQIGYSFWKKHGFKDYLHHLYLKT